MPCRNREAIRQEDLSATVSVTRTPGSSQQVCYHVIIPPALHWISLHVPLTLSRSSTLWLAFSGILASFLLAYAVASLSSLRCACYPALSVAANNPCGCHFFSAVLAHCAWFMTFCCLRWLAHPQCGYPVKSSVFMYILQSYTRD